MYDNIRGGVPLRAHSVATIIKFNQRDLNTRYNNAHSAKPKPTPRPSLTMASDSDRYVRQSINDHVVTIPPASRSGRINVVGQSTIGDDPATLEEPKPKAKSSYIPSLDGLRAFAVLAVLFYHMRSEWAPCGLMGVTIFFVLSGYLITGLLINEWRTSHRINLKNFWMKRVRRLVPAIIFLLLSLVILCAIFSPVMLTKLRQDFVSCLFFFNNWWQIFHDVSYFEAMGSPSPVTHFWSLAIEEQFYIVWPLLLLLFFRLRAKKTTIRRVIVALALISAVEMALLYVPDADPSRVYYGTDTRAFSLLIGAWLAFKVPATRVASKQWGPRLRVGFDIAAGISLAIIVVMILTVSAYEPFLYRGGYFLLSVLTAIILVALVNRRGLWYRVFSFAPLVWLGQRSYGFYLWHYPLLLLMNPPTDFTVKPWWAYLLQIAVILAVTEFSYRFIEMPVRRGIIGKTLSALSERRATFSELLRRNRTYFSGAAVLCGAAIVAAIVIPPTSAVGNAELYDESVSTDPSQAMADEGSAESVWPQEGYASSDEYLAQLPNDVTQWKILLVGDSVPLMAKSTFEEEFSESDGDCRSNRNLEEGLTVMQSWIDNGWRGDAVIVALGANTVNTDKVFTEEYEAIIDTIPENVPIFAMNIRTPGITNYSNNDIIFQVAAERDNVYLIDWYALTANHPDWFEGDGTHLNWTGVDGIVALWKELLAYNHADAVSRTGITPTETDKSADEDDTSDQSDEGNAASDSAQSDDQSNGENDDEN